MIFLRRLLILATVTWHGWGGAPLASAQTDGAQRWAFSTLSTSTAGAIVSSPSVGPDGTIYVGVEVGAIGSSSPGGRVFALNPNGTQKWVFTTPDWVDSTPAVGHDGSVYFGCWDGVFYALKSDGTKKWTYAAGGFIASSPAIAPDGTIYFGSGAGNLHALNSDGTLKWTFATDDWVESSPAVAPDGTVYFGSWNNSVYAVKPDGTQKWRFVTGGDVVGSPAIGADGTVYVASRDLTLYALNADGSVKWNAVIGETLDTSPALAPDGTVYVTTSGGRLFAFTAAGVAKWRYPAAGATALDPIYSSPAVRSDGTVVFGTSNNYLYAVKANGTLAWRTALGDWSDSSPLVTDSGIYIGCTDKKLYAFASTAGPMLGDWGQFRRDPQRQGRQSLGWVAGTTGRLINLSVRTTAGTGADTLIVGFYVAGTGARSLLVRGVGPGLTAFGVAGALADPRITAYDSAGRAVASNDNWGQAPNAALISTTATALGAFPLGNGSLDAALWRDFAGDGYTVQVVGAGTSTGVALMEAYDAGGAAAARLSNVSARSAVGTGAGILIAGFVVNAGSRAVLVRGVGPGLAQFGLAGTLVDPQLRLYSSSGQFLAENDDWSVAANSSALASAANSVGGFALPSGSKDAVMIVTLPAGAYTAQLSGAANGTGVGLVELYELP